MKKELPHDPAIPLLDMYPKESKAGSPRGMQTHVHSSIIHDSQAVEATQISINGWMDEQDVVSV